MCLLRSVCVDLLLCASESKSAGVKCRLRVREVSCGDAHELWQELLVYLRVWTTGLPRTGVSRA